MNASLPTKACSVRPFSIMRNMPTLVRPEKDKLASDFYGMSGDCRLAEGNSAVIGGQLAVK